MSLSQQQLAELVASILPAVLSTIQSHQPQSHQLQSHQLQSHQPQPQLQQASSLTTLVNSSVSITKVFRQHNQKVY